MADISEKYEELKSAIVIERSLFEEKNDIISKFIYNKMWVSDGVIVVDKLSTFFSKTNFESLMHRANVETDWALKLRAIGEKRGFAISADTINAIANFANLKHELIGEVFQINSAVGTYYELAEVPMNWNIESAFKFNKNTISNGNYTLGYKTAEKIWNIVSPIWAGLVLPTKKQYVAIGSYSRYLEIHKDQVSIGCQTVKRFEVEQIALKMGWAFPE